MKETDLYFFNYTTGQVQDSIWEELENGLWKSFLINSYLKNETLPPEFLADSSRLFPSIHQIIPGTFWSKESHKIELDLYYPKYVSDTSLNKFLQICEDYFNNLNAKKIGVHLSGGLDSGVIIGVLNTLNIPFVPIGLKSDTYEFRTERAVQDRLLLWGEDGCLINMDDYPFYSQIKTIPKHQIPDDDIKSVSATRELARQFSLRGCDVVFSGQGGDSLLVDKIDNFSKISFNIGNEFTNYTQNDRYYQPYGIKLISFYSEKRIIDFLSSARCGQKEDIKKIWMRNWAASILPKELSNYSYCADFFGLTVRGLSNAQKDIRELMEEAYDLSKDFHFSPKNIEKYLKRDILSFEFKDYINYCSLLSIASWYHSYFNN